ncbi:MAG: FtsQ-type POTRA domain-containing protein [Candidatus Saganbacteria bacterium]|nr:FtsQ-type POTRA domain-containing protein [Candidatus Saganbacteria bacterium]
MAGRKRRKEKRKRQKLPFRFRLFVIFVLLVLTGAGGYYLLSLPIWRITEITVSGAQMLSADELRDLSGIPLAENLFFTGFQRPRDNLRKITAIKEFHLYRIPPGTVLIKLIERRPIAVLLFNNKSAIVDADGYILNRNPNLTLNVPHMTELPVVLGVGSVEFAGEERIDPRASQLIASVIGELASLLGSRHLQLETGDFERIKFSLDDLLVVKVGRNEAVRRKMAVFKALLPELEGRWDKVVYVDVRYPDNPVIRYK